ncbi:MAG: hypothetical protein IT579_05235 [Verrucomicrobia subdivision 3 bacterium]|nr:hypothetical protein [Limisphaerales bacterium]
MENPGTTTDLGDDTFWNHFLALTGQDSARTRSFSRAGTHLRFCWPPDAVGFTLEYTGSLPAPFWNLVSGAGDSLVTVDTADRKRYFRLKK